MLRPLLAALLVACYSNDWRGERFSFFLVSYLLQKMGISPLRSASTQATPVGSWCYCTLTAVKRCTRCHRLPEEFCRSHYWPCYCDRATIYGWRGNAIYFFFLILEGPVPFTECVHKSDAGSRYYCILTLIIGCALLSTSGGVLPRPCYRPCYHLERRTFIPPLLSVEGHLLFAERGYANKLPPRILGTTLTLLPVAVRRWFGVWAMANIMAAPLSCCTYCTFSKVHRHLPRSSGPEECVGWKAVVARTPRPVSNPLTLTFLCRRRKASDVLSLNAVQRPGEVT